MQPLNAIDAIAPAFTRTHEILFRPFRWDRSWKLAVSQYLGMLGAAFIPFPLLLAFAPIGNLGAARTALFVVTSVMTLVTFAFFYVGVRMQFVDFEMIVTRGEMIAPMWRRYGGRVWPVIALKTVLGIVVPLALAPWVWHAGKAALQAVMSMPRPRIVPGQTPDPVMAQSMVAMMMTMVSQLMGFYAVLLCAFLVLKTFTTAFEDFALPFYILEDITLGAAIQRGLKVFAADPLQCILYLILKLVLTLIGFIAQYVSTLIAMIPLGIIGGIVLLIGILIASLARGAGSAVHLLLVVAGIVFEVAFFAVILWYQLGTYGYGATLLEAYGVYFMGGRYALLGSMLEPGPGGPFTPPPVFPSAEEQKDDDGGPPMPMDPAVA